jgi:DNA-binding CsgD family transcriptional regulator
MLSDQSLRQIAIWKLDGYTNQEIAERLGCALRTVQRKLERIQAYWSKPDD